VRHTRKANRTNSTFGFCRHAKLTLKKPKELFFANPRPKIEHTTGNRKKRNRTIVFLETQSQPKKYGVNTK